MLYIMHGLDDYSINEEVENIKKDLGDPEMLSVNTSVVDGRGLVLSQLIEMCNSVPFLHTVRLVIVKGLLERFEQESVPHKRGNKSKSKMYQDGDGWEDIDSLISNMPDSTVLILIDNKVIKKNRLLQKLTPSAKVKVFPKLQNRNLASWITKRVAYQGGSISEGAVAMLMEFIGGDLWIMSSEIEKLLVYTDGRIISESDVKQLTNFSKESSIFSLVDAIIERKRSIAHKLFHKLLNEGVTVPYMMAMITRQLRLIVVTKDLKERKMSPGAIQNAMGMSSDYAMQKVLTQCEKYTAEQLKNSYRKILDADIAIKTGKYDSDLAIDLLVVELCS